jgi:hypothetical protein
MKHIEWEKYTPIEEEEDDDVDFGSNTMRFILPGEAAQKKFLNDFNLWVGHTSFKITQWYATCFLGTSILRLYKDLRQPHIFSQKKNFF